MPEPAVAVRVWDLPTRLFHWLLALTIIGSVVSAKLGGDAMVWHVRLGLTVMTLLAFRLVWGVIGGRWSRFASFLYAPSALRDYLRGGSGPGGRYDVGHSPLGALSVFALLLLLIAQVATGLVADDEIATTGPLYRFVSNATVATASAWHSRWGQWLIYLLVVAHIGAVLYYLRAKRRNLIRPMLDGDKTLPAGIPASVDGPRERVVALAVVLIMAALAWCVGRLGN
jgi:cytochrome b